MKLIKFISHNSCLRRQVNVGRKNLLNFTVLFIMFLFAAQLILIQGAEKTMAADTLWDAQQKTGFQEEIGEGAFGQDRNNPQDIRITAARMIKGFLGLLGIVFIILLILAGYKWMTSRGNDQAVTEAKSQITRAVIGLAIIMVSWGITAWITECLSVASGIEEASPSYCPALK